MSGKNASRKIEEEEEDGVRDEGKKAWQRATRLMSAAVAPPWRLSLLLPAIFVFLSCWLLLFCSTATHKRISQLSDDLYRKLSAASEEAETCRGGPWVYVYDLPPEFNAGLLHDCSRLNMHRDMCPHVANRGLGQPLPTAPPGSPSSSSWFSTNQFTAEMIFHARAENHPCRTRDPAKAAIFYAPFYGGLYASSKFRERNLTARDALATRFVEYLGEQPWWHRRHGHDHFLVLGRTAWDFMRGAAGEADYGASSLLTLPRIRNMTALVLERHPAAGPGQQGIPYPSYFHPSRSEEMLWWQQHVRRSRRPHLFSFVGAPRAGQERNRARAESIRQCNASRQCRLLLCGGRRRRCGDPTEVVGAMAESRFCLQPAGDSSTRRSTFDAILAGCIPVYFSRQAAETQYGWFLPAEAEAYSVRMDARENRIEEELRRIPAERERRMRGVVVDLIPTVTYAHPNATHHRFPDAVDVALDAVSRHVHSNLVAI